MYKSRQSISIYLIILFLIQPMQGMFKLGAKARAPINRLTEKSRYVTCSRTLFNTNRRKTNSLIVDGMVLASAAGCSSLLGYVLKRLNEIDGRLEKIDQNLNKVEKSK